MYKGGEERKGGRRILARGGGRVNINGNQTPSPGKSSKGEGKASAH